ncbi:MULTISPECIES: SpoIIE family protein phosphatase [Streptomyces]|uniref:PAS domain-containing protein n=1 Tax=Streptomyces dengpaensis TaxID=2049881 RepID=A0ABM6T0R7_9ACTN|nr:MULTISPECIES: SpoIIE family protein phosphatase [Streptomyces]AVH60546.1 PAS domain-containing protein [Streptomyces dengpaensis]PIB07529.1 diguanylate cyclase [Streptomyces sp. HG99]
MTGSAGLEDQATASLATLLSGAVTDAIRAARGFAGGVYLRSSTPGLLRLAVLAGLPGQLFRPWWHMYMDRPLPVADVHRSGVEVLLADATETMRRYPQLAAGLPFPFGSLYVPVVGASIPFGVLTVLRPSASDATEVLPDRDRMTTVADELGAALAALEKAGTGVFWDGEPLCRRPPVACPSSRAVGGFTWDPADGTVTADDALWTLLGTSGEGFAGTPEALAYAVNHENPRLLLAALRETAAGRPPPHPLPVRTADGGLRLLELWTSGAAPAPPYRVSGVVVDPGPGTAADGAADLLPEGVFALDRLGLITYANPRAAELLGLARTELLGRPLLQAVPWLDRPAYEDHLRGALLSPDPVHFQVTRPRGDGREATSGSTEGASLTLSVYPGPDSLTCKIVPVGRVADTTVATPFDTRSVAAEQPDADAPGTDAVTTAPLYRPIALAIALTEAVTARQVSEMVMRELLPAFGGRRLAIYLVQDRRLYLAWETGFPQGFLAQFDGAGLDAKLPGVEALTSGRPLFFESMERLEAAYPGMALDASHGARAYLPLIASGRPVGSCTLGFDRPRGFSTEDRTVLTALAGLIAQALERARRYDNEAALARGLQEALLPHRLSAHPLVRTTGRYLPGTLGMDVGGDWYDVVEAGDGLALVIGDVQGHGVQAAATMGQLRSAVRAFAHGDHSPDEVMNGTNRLLIDLDPGQFASCCYVRLDPVTGVVRAARAGHPQPLLRHPDGRTEVLDLPGGVVLGVDRDARYPVTDLLLEPDAVLALYTDGLVERPGTDIDEGVETLRATLSRASSPPGRRGGPSLSRAADLLTAEARKATERPDDIALLLTTRRSPGGGGQYRSQGGVGH